MALRRAREGTAYVDEAVQAFVDRCLPAPDEVLRTLKEVALQEGIPSITPDAGRALMTVVRTVDAKRALELGTGTGYSGIWIARGLNPKGRLVTVEGDAARAARARQRFSEAGLGGRVEVQVGRCLEVIRAQSAASLDFVFVDATKSEYPDYLEASRRALRAGGVMAADNVFWQGQALKFDPQIRGGRGVEDPELAGVLEFDRRIGGPEWSTMILPFGDGLSLSVKQ